MNYNIILSYKIKSCCGLEKNCLKYIGVILVDQLGNQTLIISDEY